MLTEKGVLVSRLVLEFAEENGQKLEMRTRWRWTDVASVVKRKLLATSAGILTIIAACLSFCIGIVGGIAFLKLGTAARYWGYNIAAFFSCNILWVCRLWLWHNRGHLYVKKTQVFVSYRLPDPLTFFSRYLSYSPESISDR